jgi:ABC-type polysaccharide/polyol phosphate transport system ATPase subunit
VSEKAISIRKLNLSFFKSESDNYSFKKFLMTGKLLPEKKTIFKNFSLDVSESTILGIEGSNGIGKTSLLAAIAGLIPHESGEIKVSGKVLPLLGLGHVFHPDLDIKRNIELWNLSFKMNLKVNDDFIKMILENSGLDVTPSTILRSLSSGMKSRLAFELAMHGDENILLLDEVFAVGDKQFRHESSLKMKKKLNSLKCAVIISHDFNVLKENCNRVIRITNQSEIEEVS